MRKQPPTREVRPPPLKVDAEKYPNLKANPSLERALRIRQALDQGKPRDEAVRLAEVAMGRTLHAAKSARPKPKARGKARKA